jgi:uncharacterized membrane protein (UPF0127 family)
MRKLAAVLLLVVAPLVQASPHTPSSTSKSVVLTLHGDRFSAELATDDAAREHGLMERTSLEAGHGMLFVFPDLAPRWFWMKNTLIPLDILYFGDQRQLVSMQLNVPPCKGDPCPSYPSGRPARYVLEVPAGTAAQLGIQVGDRLEIEGKVGPVR